MGNPPAQRAMDGYDMTTETFDNVDVAAYAAAIKKKGSDPDFPVNHQAMMSPQAEQWQEACGSEVNTLVGMGTWTIVTRKNVQDLGRKVIPLTWALRLKRMPDGTLYKYKAGLCVRGDRQVYGEDYWQSFSPVCQWSSVRLLLVLSIGHNMHTRQVDYHQNEEDCVLKLA